MSSLPAADSSVTKSFGDAWNAFWYTPVDAPRVGLLRFAVGFCALIYLALWSVDLERFLSPEGLLPPEAMTEAVSADPLYYPWRYSLLDYLPNRAALWGFHIGAICAAALCMLGVAGRWMTIVTLVAVLSYIHRAPILMSPQEPLLAWGLLYLCLAPSGSYFSIDHLWSRKPNCGCPSVTANIALRLIQVHLTLHYFYVAVTQLSDRVWWNGSAAWVLMAQTRTRGLDLTMVRESTFLLNGITHLLVFLALALAFFPWNDRFRPIANGLVLLYAVLVAALTGLWVYALALVALQIAFCDDAKIARYFGLSRADCAA